MTKFISMINFLANSSIFSADSNVCSTLDVYLHSVFGSSDSIPAAVKA